MDRQVKTPGDLPGYWRERAQHLREWGSDPQGAKVWALAATELEQALRTMAEETLNLQEAARESGYSADHLGELVREGKLPNAGRKNAPRIRRADLPVKMRGPEPHRRSPSTPRGSDIEQLASKLR